MTEKTILVMAGGTGGHVYPALAVAEFLREQGIRLFWMGTRAGIESRVVPEKGFQLLLVHVSGLRGKTLLRRISAPFMLLFALLQSLLIMLRYKPDVVLGLGGFTSGPGGIAAWLMRIPLFIHEQNAIAGLTNRLLAPFSRRVLLGFPGALIGKNVLITGNPVRRQIAAIDLPRIRYSQRAGQPLRLLVLGGSLGAAALNEVVPAVLAALPGSVRVEARHQTGISHFEKTRHLYEQQGLSPAKVDAYIDDMAEAYSWADLVLCRAGASTIGELCSAGVASILVPYPHAVDDHQTANARYLSEAGAAVLLPQFGLTVARLMELLTQFHNDRGLLLEMAVVARNKAFADATVRIGGICMEAAHG